MTQITVELPDEVVAGLGGDPAAIARTLADLAVERWLSERDEQASERKASLSDAEFQQLCEEIAENYDFNAWKELRRRSLN